MESIESRLEEIDKDVIVSLMMGLSECGILYELFEKYIVE